MDSKLMHRNANKNNTFIFMGDIYSILVSGGDTNGEYCVLECTAKKDAGPPLHLHEIENETFYIIEGEMAFTVGEDKFIASKGDYLFAPRGIPHTFKVNSDEVKFLVTLYPAGFDNFVKEMAVPYTENMDLPVGSPSLEEVQQLIEVAKRYKLFFQDLRMNFKKFERFILYS